MRYLVIHPLEPGLTRERVLEIEKAAQTDPDIKGYRSFLNLTEGRGVCLFDAPDRERLERWLDKHELKYDTIWPVEMEGKRGETVDIPTEVGVGGTCVGE